MSVSDFQTDHAFLMAVILLVHAWPATFLALVQAMLSGPLNMCVCVRGHTDGMERGEGKDFAETEIELEQLELYSNCLFTLHAQHERG